MEFSRSSMLPAGVPRLWKCGTQSGNVAYREMNEKPRKGKTRTASRKHSTS
jgi:hypothetical protein